MISYRSLFFYTLLLSPLALAQDATDITLQEIDKNCREWASQDDVPADELEAYLADCRRLEAESYGITDAEQAAEVEEAEASETPDSGS